MKFGSGSNEKLVAIRGNSDIISLVSWVFRISQGEKLPLRFKYVFFIKCYQGNLESTVCRSSIEKSIREERLDWGNSYLADFDSLGLW